MTEERKQEITNDFVGSGNIPDQETFTKEETLYLVNTALCWASLQLEHMWEENIQVEDIPSLVRECEFVTPEEALDDFQSSSEEHIYQTSEFIRTWLCK